MEIWECQKPWFLALYKVQTKLPTTQLLKEILLVLSIPNIQIVGNMGLEAKKLT